MEGSFEVLKFYEDCKKLEGGCWGTEYCRYVRVTWGESWHVFRLLQYRRGYQGVYMSPIYAMSSGQSPHVLLT